MSEVNWNDNARAAVIEFHEWVVGELLMINQNAVDEFMATRAQQKTVEDAVEQEGEKWTHTYSDYGVRKDCILIHDKPDIHGQVLIMNRYGEYVLTGTAELKPIKLKLTKSQAWDLCQDYDGPKSMKAHMYDLHEEYEII